MLRSREHHSDGIDDLLASSYQDGTIKVLRNDGDGSFTVQSPTNVIGFESWFELLRSVPQTEREQVEAHDRDTCFRKLASSTSTAASINFGSS